MSRPDLPSDRELLEQAARAAGIDFRLHTEFGLWNPLQHDGDALRLAVKLHIQVSPRDLTVAAYQWGGLGIQHRTYSQEHYADNEPTAATRRAIVRAAAALNPGGSDVR